MVLLRLFLRAVWAAHACRVHVGPSCCEGSLLQLKMARRRLTLAMPCFALPACPLQVRQRAALNLGDLTRMSMRADQLVSGKLLRSFVCCVGVRCDAAPVPTSWWQASRCTLVSALCYCILLSACCCRYSCSVACACRRVIMELAGAALAVQRRPAPAGGAACLQGSAAVQLHVALRHRRLPRRLATYVCRLGYRRAHRGAGNSRGIPRRPAR